jgi:hypothetical protein
MKKMAELMSELGFKPDASEDVKKAFIKNLIKQAQASEAIRTFDKKIIEKDSSKDVENYQQISLFDQKKSS